MQNYCEKMVRVLIIRKYLIIRGKKQKQKGKKQKKRQNKNN